MALISEKSRMRGVLLGTAVGDALGLPAEGVSRRRVARLFDKPWRHHLIFGHGMVSDDTEHTVFTSQALIAHPDSAARFARRFAWSLRWWFLSLPAGIGLGTLRSIVRLWLGFSPDNSGVRSAGNGAAMRVAPIGAVFWREPDLQEAYVVASTRVTHRDPRALVGARVVATLCAWCFAHPGGERPDPDEFEQLLRRCGSDDPQWLEIADGIAHAVAQDWQVQQYADSLGLGAGVSGYIYHTVPVVSFAWYRHFGDFEATLSSVLDCGGDADTTGAIAGALAGAVVGDQGIPPSWIEGIVDWPRGPKLLYRLADRLSDVAQSKRPTRAVPYFWPGLVIRNLLFLVVVLLHGFRRLAPPY